MHVKKNVCNSVIDTLLNIQDKSKDGLNTHQDLVEMGIRDQLHPRSDGNKIYLPPACHTLSKKEKISFFNVYTMSKCHKDTLQILRAL